MRQRREWVRGGRRSRCGWQTIGRLSSKLRKVELSILMPIERGEFSKSSQKVLKKFEKVRFVASMTRIESSRQSCP